MKKILMDNFGLKILSLLFAIILWLTVVNIDDPKTTRTISGIPVTILDEEVVVGNNQIYSIKSGQEVTISVTGPRSMVDKMTKEYFIAEAPFSEKSNVDAVPIYVSFRNSKYDKDCEISQKTMTMKLEIENVIEKTFDISINHASILSTAYYLGNEVVNPATVTVSAPESIINQIDEARIDVELSGRTEDFSTESNIKYYTASGTELNVGNNFTSSLATTYYSADIYQIREVPLKFGYIGNVQNGYELVEITAEKTTVKIVGPSATEVESIVCPNELLNISDATEYISVEADITSLLPKGVYLCNESDEIVKITAKIEKLITKNYRIPVSEIDKNNIPVGFIAEILEQNVNLSLTGLQKSHDEFSINEITAYVDLKNTIEGNNEVIVKLNIPGELKVTNEVTVNVNLKKDVTREETETSEDLTENTEETTQSQ
ncbi:MAG: hypothetical protein IJA34_05915 [Lachnospiraceae bacterium]|nr:hypothetical protein [Lachnospiraceae bacterium]